MWYACEGGAGGGGGERSEGGRERSVCMNADGGVCVDACGCWSECVCFVCVSIGEDGAVDGVCTGVL